jgi:raffinose/stachyose/melibiose transport system permease protein
MNSIAMLPTAPRVTAEPAQPPARPKRRKSFRRPNLLGGLAGWIWLAIIIVPLYYVLITSMKNQADYFTTNPLLPAGNPTLDNYALVLQNDFVLYFVNSLLVTVGSVVPAVIVSFMAAYGVTRGTTRVVGGINTLFLLGLSIPLQATIIPVYWLIVRLNLYDNLIALMLPSIAFAIPVSVLILSNFMRDIPKELFESMRLDGCTEWTIMWRLVFPLIRPAITTIAVYNALNVWNGFLFPLILTQSPEKRVLPLSLWAYQDEFTVNTPAILAAVVLSAIPLVAVYILGRRQLVSGLTGGFSK